MSYHNLHEFIKSLESTGELLRISAEVNPFLEITEIADRTSKSLRPALLFERVKDSQFPLLINAFGSYKRMQMALNCNSFDEIGNKLDSLIRIQPPESLKDKIKIIFMLKDLAGLSPKKVKKAPCQDKVFGMESPLLDMLPILTCWPGDGGPFVTLPLVITRDPDNGIQNIGMYRMQKYDRATTGMHWQYNKDGTRHFDKYKGQGTKNGSSRSTGRIACGDLCGQAPLPPDVNELILAGLINGEAVDVVRGKDGRFTGSGESDFIIEGYVDPREEGRGTVRRPHRVLFCGRYLPRFSRHLHYRRKEAIYPATVVGKPPMEDCYMAKATERIFLPLLSCWFRQSRTWSFPSKGCSTTARWCRSEGNPGEARKVIHALWGLGQMASTKYIAIFDNDIDFSDYSTVVWKLLNNVDPRRDIVFSEGPLDALDHSAPFANFGGKMGIDATRKTREEGMGQGMAREITMSNDIKNLSKRWKEYGF